MNVNHELSNGQDHETDHAKGHLAIHDDVELKRWARCQADRIRAMTMEEVEEELCRRGIDPKAAVERVRRCIEEGKLCSDGSRS